MNKSPQINRRVIAQNKMKKLFPKVILKFTEEIDFLSLMRDSYLVLLLICTSELC